MQSILSTLHVLYGFSVDWASVPRRYEGLVPQACSCGRSPGSDEHVLAKVEMAARRKSRFRA